MTTTSSRSYRRAGILVAVVAATVAGLLVPGDLIVGAADPLPSVRLRRATDTVEVSRYPGEPAYLALGTYVVATGGAFELRAQRVDEDSVAVRQVVPGDGGGLETVQELPKDLVKELSGLPRFFLVTARDLDGNVVDRSKAPFCPGGYDRARVDLDGPDLATYPDACYASQPTRGLVWGVDDGWGVQAPLAPRLDLDDGAYDVTVLIRRRYRNIFDIDFDDARAELRVKVTVEDEPPWIYESEARAQQAGGTPGRPGDRHTHAEAHVAGEPLEVQDNAEGLPDLRSLPARALRVRNRPSGVSRLEFAATIWNAGPGPLVFEGFRRPNRDVMDAYQYFYRNGRAIDREEVGTMEYDDRSSHRHWHFTDFGRYRLLDADGGQIVRSRKEAFCVVPTDAVDLTVEGANWFPGQTGLTTACGGEQSLWIREILDVGWGDTYYQSIAGQSYDVTDLPNGVYYVEVATNPKGNIIERDQLNNTALRKIRLRGPAGARTVEGL